MSDQFQPDQLEPRYENFLSDYEAEHGLPESETYLDLVRSAFKETPEGRMTIITSLMQSLKGYFVHPSNSTDPKIREGYNVLLNWVNEHELQFNEHQSTILLFGSMIYSDSVNLDLDTIGVALSSTTDLNEFFKDTVSNLESKWKQARIGAEPHHYFHTVDEMGPQMQDDESFYENLGDNEDYHHIIANLQAATIVLTGLPVYISSGMDLENLKNGLLQRIVNDPYWSAICIAQLTNTLETREKRRGDNK
jgi:hypothetical protein